MRRTQAIYFCLEKDIKTEGRTFSSGLLLGISKYRTPERGLSITKAVHIDHFLDNGGLFFGLYQGYNGTYVANLCARELHKDIKDHLQYFSDIGVNSEMIKTAFQEAYMKIDRLQLIGEGEHYWRRWSGCSAVTCLIINEILYVANEGNVKGFLIRENNTIRAITSSHDLYNRKERLRVRRNCGVIVKTERSALVNGILDTTRGLGNQGDWRLKLCVINKPKFRVVNLRLTDKLIVLASEGVWKVFSHDDVLFLLNKFLRDASCKRQPSERSLLKSKTPDDQGFLGIPLAEADSEYRAYLRRQNVDPIDARVTQFVRWNPDNPTITIRRATVMEEEPLLEDEAANISKKYYFTEAEQDDEDLQELSKLLANFNAESSYTRREIARLLSKRLLKSALIAGAETDNVAIVLLLKGFDLEEHKYMM
jgi:serine/threonine protein phosphatase PrpC